MKDSKRIPEIDGLRALAILAVFVHHALEVPFLWIGVDLFFVISGFLITGILLDLKLKSPAAYFQTFYKRRARRILPPCALLLLLSSLLFGTAWVKHWYWYAFFGTNIAVVLGQAGHDTLQLLWSLAVEEQFYLVWPVVILLLSENALLKTAIALVLLVPVLRAAATPQFHSHFPIYYLTPFRMDLLSAGALLALIWRNKPGLFQLFSSRAGVIAGGTAVLLAVLSRSPQFRTSSNTMLSNAFIYSMSLVMVTCLMGLALRREGLLCRLLIWPPLRYIGIISYSMYLIHTTVIALAAELPWGRAAQFGLSFAMMVLYATLTWYGFEKRLLKANVSLRPTL